MATEKVIEIPAIEPTVATLTIVGDSDLVLNKMNDRTVRQLTDERNDKAKKLEKPKKWEDIATSIHWLYGKPNIAPEEYSEETMNDLLENNAPCLPSFGMKQQLCKAVVRNKLEQYKTGFDANVNILGKGDGLIPINFTAHFIDEKLMSPKRGKPVLARLNRFNGWSAEVTVSFLESAYSLESIVNIFNIAGFGLGVGSGTSSGYGRFHVEHVQ